MHDDASELANKKCRLLWINEEYDKLHAELMQTLRQPAGGDFDSSGSKDDGFRSEGLVDKQKALSDKLENLDEEMNDLNKDINDLNEKFYKKYDDKEMAALTRDVKSQVALCKP